MILFVEDDRLYVEPFCRALEESGYVTKIIGNADDAYRYLATSMGGIDLVILDVLVATGFPSIFRRDETEFTMTGIALFELLHEVHGKEFSSKVLFFSMTSNQSILEAIEMCCRQKGAKFLSKDDFTSPWEFAEAIASLVGPTHRRSE